MPQMAPLSWLILFIMFSTALIMFNAMNYYTTMTISPKPQQSNIAHIKTMIWKW
uniref:ATP synthase complex subunit 8 n=1 Tax=Satanas sp. KW-2016 TaxID=1812712 RepID=A0A164R3I3_9MUSC|nr:ATP synthase F0 subunit 8 [Satanas sp. KW-2016]